MSEERTENDNLDAPREAKISFFNLRSNFYREINADGVFGTVTPNFDIHMTFYNQHSRAPKEQLFQLREDGTLGREISKENEGEIAREIERELEAGVTISIPTAISLIRWLRQKVNEAQQIIGELPVIEESPKNAENELSK